MPLIDPPDGSAGPAATILLMLVVSVGVALAKTEPEVSMAVPPEFVVVGVPVVELPNPRLFKILLPKPPKLAPEIPKLPNRPLAADGMLLSEPNIDNGDI